MMPVFPFAFRRQFHIIVIDRTKIQIGISGALEKGLGDGVTAIGNLQKALEEEVKGLGSDFTEAWNQTIKKLQTLAAEMAPNEFAKSIQGILTSVQGYAQTAETLLKKLQQEVQKL